MLAGFLGIGGGIILVPMMTGLLYLDQHRAHGTSLAIIVPIAMMGTLVYGLRGDVNWEWVAIIGAGSVIGAVVGSKLMMRVPWGHFYRPCCGSDCWSSQRDARHRREHGGNPGAGPATGS